MTESSSARLGLPYLASGQAQKDITHNEALALIDMGLAPAALSMDLGAPPADPAIGACWIVGEAASAEWSGEAGKLACRVAGGWRFLAAPDGMRVWLADRNLWAQRVGGTWSAGVEHAAEIRIGGDAVLGARKVAVVLPDGGATIDGEARAAIAAIVDRLRAHGLIA